MNDKVEDLQQDLTSFKLQDDKQVSGSFSPSNHRNIGPSRPKLFLPMGSSSSGRQLPPSLPLQFPGDRFKAVANEEQERKLKEIMSQNGVLQIDGKQYNTKIDEMELMGDLGNGTCGHVVQMRHKETGSEIAVKQMRRTGNSDENKRILMDLDVVLKSHDCENIVLCLGCFITDSDVWICMELMATCFDKLLKQLKQPIPEPICGKVAVSTLKALNYLKESHGVIHRDVKPSNILLDTLGRVKLCDFGISGRLVDSKAKTRSAGCAAYMAPERIEPPNPNKPDYDIRADVWSLGITLVELATGSFPYRDCKTDFEVLTKVLAETPPVLPVNDKFSSEFRSFVANCLIKDYKDRPKYKKLLSHEFILKYDKEDVDVGAWYRSHLKNISNSSTTTPNNNQFTFDNLTSHNFSIDRSFKPQPSPRVPRSRGQTSHSSTTTYPAALADRDRRPSYEVPDGRRKLSGYSDASSKPPTSLTSPIEAHRNFFPHQKQPFYKPPDAHDQSSSRSQTKYFAAPGTSSSSYSSGRPYELHTASNGASIQSTPNSSNLFTNLPRSTAYFPAACKPDSSKAFNFTHNPRPAAKFEFTNPSTSYNSHQSAHNLSPHHRQNSALVSSPVTNSTGRTQDPYQYYQLPKHSGYQQQHTSIPQSLPPTSTSRSAPFSPTSGASGLNLSSKKDRLSRSDAVGTVGDTEPLSSPSSSSSSSTTRASYFLPTSWRSTFNSITNSMPSPMLLRRMRTASTDRTSSFDTSRRFQPNYRSWNEKDNFYPSSKR